MEKTNRLLERTGKIAKIISSIIIVAGIVFAAFQYRLTDEINKRESSINAINKVYNLEFINSFTNLKGCVSIDSKALNDDLNFVFNTYYMIAVIYNSNIANREIIDKGIYNGVHWFINSDIYKNKKGWGEEKKEINTMYSNMNPK